MLKCIKIIDTNQKEVIRFSYGEFNNFSQQQKYEIFNMKQNLNYKLLCYCNKKPVEITISSISTPKKTTYYLKNEKQKSKLHKYFCPLGEGASNSNVDLRWSKVDGNYFFKPRKGLNCVQENQSDLQNLLIRINLLAWNTQVDKCKKQNISLAEISKEGMLKAMFGWSNKIYIKGESNLKQLWVNNDFSIFYISGITDTKYKHSKLIEGILPNNSKQNYYCSLNMLEESFALLNKSISSIDFSNESYLACSFLKNNKLTSLVILPINHQGLFTESVDHEKVYNKLITENRIFKRGVFPDNHYYGFVPDFIFEDTLHNYYGEIFNNKDSKKLSLSNYVEKLELILHNYSETKIWYWDVAKKNKMLPFPAIKKQNNNRI